MSGSQSMSGVNHGEVHDDQLMDDQLMDGRPMNDRLLIAMIG